MCRRALRPLVSSDTAVTNAPSLPLDDLASIFADGTWNRNQFGCEPGRDQPEAEVVGLFFDSSGIRVAAGPRRHPAVRLWPHRVNNLAETRGLGTKKRVRSVASLFVLMRGAGVVGASGSFAALRMTTLVRGCCGRAQGVTGVALALTIFESDQVPGASY